VLGTLHGGRADQSVRGFGCRAHFMEAERSKPVPVMVRMRALPRSSRLRGVAESTTACSLVMAMVMVMVMVMRRVFGVGGYGLGFGRESTTACSVRCAFGVGVQLRLVFEFSFFW